MNKFVIILLICSAIASCTSPEDPDITKQELKGHLKFLASDSLKGRFPGTPEDRIAARYILGEFAKAGLDIHPPFGLQEFEVIMSVKAGENNLLTCEEIQGVIHKDFTPAPFSASVSGSGEVVFAGYGFKIDLHDLQWNDYDLVDPEGKWVMVLRGNPDMDSTSSPFDPFSDDRDKAMLAGDMGAVGLILVSGVHFDPDDNLMNLNSRASAVGIPVIHVTRDFANRILGKSNQTIQEIEREISEKRMPVGFNCSTRRQVY